MKPLVIYHANCADGFGAAFAAWLKLGDEAEYKPCAYGDKDFTHPFDIRENVEERDIYILDFSFPRPVMDQIFEDAARVVWLDHHKTAFEMWCDYPFLKGNHHCDVHYQGRHHTELNDNKSGAMLAWEYFHPGTEVPLLIQHIDDYDRWQFKIDGTKAFNKALWSYAPWSFHQWESNFLPFYDAVEYDRPYNNFIEQGEAILRAHDQNVQSVVKGSAMACELSTYTTDSYGALYSGLAANCPPFLQSDVGHELATKSGTFGLLWYIDKDNQCKCSLRSNGDYDVSAIAKAFGGGGHRNAAGFTTDIQTLLEWIK